MPTLRRLASLEKSFYLFSLTILIMEVSSLISLSSPPKPTDLNWILPFLSMTNFVGTPSTLNCCTTLSPLSINTRKSYLLAVIKSDAFKLLFFIQMMNCRSYPKACIWTMVMLFLTYLCCQF